MCIYNMCVRLNLNPSGLKTININEKEEEEKKQPPSVPDSELFEIVNFRNMQQFAYILIVL